MSYLTRAERDRIVAGFSAREVIAYADIGGYVTASRLIRAEAEVVRLDEERAMVLAERKRQRPPRPEMWEGAEESRVKVVMKTKRRRRAA